MQTLGEELREIEEIHGISGYRLSEIMGMPSRDYYSTRYRSHNKTPTTFQAIAIYYMKRSLLPENFRTVTIKTTKRKVK